MAKGPEEGKTVAESLLESISSGRVAPEAAGLAALSLAESLVFLLVEEGLIGKEAVQDALEDAVDAQRQAADQGGPLNHGAAATLIERIMDALEAVDLPRERRDG